MRFLPFMIAATVVAALACACADDKRETIAISADPETFPTMRTINVSTLISDSGYTRYHITTPLWLMFEEAREPHWSFPDGMFIVQFNDSLQETGTFTSDTATYYSAKKLWQFDRNVRMRNIDGDRFLTQQLFWDQNTHKVYSDSFIHIERADRIIEGYGFVSNETMTSYTIKNPSGIFPTGDFVSDGGGKRGGGPANDTVPTATVSPAAAPAPGGTMLKPVTTH